jgi:hypothetical protein
MNKQNIISFELIKELASPSFTIQDLKNRINELENINKIELEQELANKNITKILKK